MGASRSWERQERVKLYRIASASRTLGKNHRSATSAKICVKKANLAKICVKLSLKNGKKVVEYTEKCPPLLAEKPVYIKNAFWATLCVTTIGIVHCRHIID